VGDKAIYKKQIYPACHYNYWLVTFFEYKKTFRALMTL
jgi:hypothetical protein